MQEPFPELTHLALRSRDGSLLPETFLVGPAPRLRYCCLDYLPFPALRKLLLSSSHLVILRLDKIPHSMYISPEAMVACLAVATSLVSLDLKFLSLRSRPNRATRRPPPLIRTILPALTDLFFQGVSEYSEDFISRVDAPLLNRVTIYLFHQLALDLSQLHQFIRRTDALSSVNVANLEFGNRQASVQLVLTSYRSFPKIKLLTQCSGSDRQLSFLAQTCSSLSPTLSTFETLNVRNVGFRPLRTYWEDDMENSQWLELFRPFTSVRYLSLSEEIVPLVGPALQQLAEESVTDVLPVLQKLRLQGLEPSEPIPKDIGQFVAARRLLNHPITVESWDGPW
ncbi:hypothetical protein BJV74DRAFT_256993 [Russula compacta]|nr:hypothetical protein BJV74DRAFT_256993 [Russula compacta]